MNESDLKQDSKKINFSIDIGKIAFGTKLIVGMNMLMYLLSFILGSFVKFFISEPLVTIEHFHILSILGCSLVEISIFTLIGGGICFYWVGHERECKVGTIKFLLEYLGYSALIQAVFTVLVVLLSEVTEIFDSQFSNGMWPYILMEYSAKCFKEPMKKAKIGLIPVLVWKIAHPFIFIVLVWLSSWTIRLDVLCAVFIAYLVSALNLEETININDENVAKIEGIKAVDKIKRLSGFRDHSEPIANQDSQREESEV